VLFDEIAYVYFVRKIYLIYFRTENSQPRAGTGTVPTGIGTLSFRVCSQKTGRRSKPQRRPVANRQLAREIDDKPEPIPVDSSKMERELLELLLQRKSAAQHD